MPLEPDADGGVEARTASDGSLVRCVSTIPIAISPGSVVVGPGVGRSGIAFDCSRAGGIAVAALLVLLPLGCRRIGVPAACPTPEPC